MATVYFPTVALLVACAVLVSAAPVWESKEDIAREMIIQNLANQILMRSAKKQTQGEREMATIQKQAQRQDLPMFLQDYLDNQKVEQQAPTAATFQGEKLNIQKILESLEAKQQAPTAATIQKVNLQKILESLEVMKQQAPIQEVELEPPTPGQEDRQREVALQNIFAMINQLEKDELADQEADQEAAEQEVDEEEADEQEAGEQEVDEEEADEQEAGEQNVEEQVLDSSMITQEEDKEVTLQGLSTKLSELQELLEQINERLVQEQDDQVEEKNEEVVEMEDSSNELIAQEDGEENEQAENKMTVQDLIAMLNEMKTDQQAEQEVDEQAEQEVDQQAEEEVEQEADVQETDREVTLQGLSTQLTELQDLLGKINEQLVQEQTVPVNKDRYESANLPNNYEAEAEEDNVDVMFEDLQDEKETNQLTQEVDALADDESYENALLQAFMTRLAQMQQHG